MSDTQRGPEPSRLVTTFQYDPENRLVSVEAPTPPGTKQGILVSVFLKNRTDTNTILKKQN
jgi:hypothetical protein